MTSVVAQYAGQIWEGAEITIGVAVGSFMIGLPIGGLAAAAKLSPWPALRLVAEAYTTLVRGVPELLIILLLYYGGTVALSALAGEYVEVDALTSGLVALSFLSGAYATEVIRGAVQAIAKGQIEAAKACGMPPLLILRRIMLPQIIRYALPGLGNVWLVLLKDTSLVSVVNLEELMRKTAIAAGATRQPFTFYGIAALSYLGFTIVSMGVIAVLERRTQRGVRRAGTR